MPTADEYRFAAHRFDELAIEVVRDIETIVGPWDTVATGGFLGPFIDATVGDATADLESMARRLISVSDECKRRARICDAYAAEIAMYRSNPDLFDEFPQPPYEWVELEERPASQRFLLGGMW